MTRTYLAVLEPGRPEDELVEEAMLHARAVGYVPTGEIGFRPDWLLGQPIVIAEVTVTKPVVPKGAFVDWGQGLSRPRTGDGGAE